MKAQFAVVKNKLVELYQSKPLVSSKKGKENNHIDLYRVVMFILLFVGVVTSAMILFPN